jgi:hypothetical protein
VQQCINPPNVAAIYFPISDQWRIRWSRATETIEAAPAYLRQKDAPPSSDGTHGEGYE